MRGIKRPKRLAGVGSLLATVGVMAVSAGVAQAAVTPIGPPATQSGSCDPGTNGSNVAQLCGANVTVDPGNPGPYTVAYYQDLVGAGATACPVPYVAGAPTITSNDPANLSFTGGTLGTNPVCTGTGGGDEVGGTAPITATVANANPGTYTVTTTIVYTGPGCSPASCTRTVTSTVTVGPGLTVVKSGPTTARAGQLTSYTFTVTNSSANTTYGAPGDPVTVTDVLPAGVFYSGGSPGCVATNNIDGTTTVTCPVADSLTPGASGTATITVVPTTNTTINNTATATGTAQGPGGTSTTSPPSNTVTTVVAPACTKTVTGTINSSIVVPSGTVLCLTNANVIGSVIVNKGGGLVVTNSTIAGGVGSQGAIAFQLCGSTVRGSVSVSTSTGQVRIGGDGGDPACAPNTIRGSVTLTANTNGVDLIGNTIGGGVSVRNNSGSLPLSEDATVEIESNIIHAALSCTGNTPGVTNDNGAHNTAAVKVGQCQFL